MDKYQEKNMTSVISHWEKKWKSKEGFPENLSLDFTSTEGIVSKGNPWAEMVASKFHQKNCTREEECFRPEEAWSESCTDDLLVP